MIHIAVTSLNLALCKGYYRNIFEVVPYQVNLGTDSFSESISKLKVMWHETLFLILLTSAVI